MPNRFLDLTSGVAMVVSDLHGDRDAFDRCLTEFSALYWRGDAQRLILLGDLIHSYDDSIEDASVQMVLDLIALQRQLSTDTVIMLLGNHEMPHIYGVSLSKGEVDFSPRFEHALGQHRNQILSFFESLPFYVRTAAGVTLSHAGPSLETIQRINLLRGFDHQAILQEADLILTHADDIESFYQQYEAIYGASYDEIAYHYLGIEGPDDPRYSHLLRAFLISRQSQEFEALWEALFTQNDYGLSKMVYQNGCQHFLAAISEDAPAEQQVIVSGHIAPRKNGYQVVNSSHLRIASAAHARPRESGVYLLLDCAQPVETADDLVDGLRYLFV